MGIEIQVEYLGGLRCELKHMPSGATFQTDAPRDNHGKGELFSPTDLVASALLSCAMTTMAIKGPQQGVALDKVKGRVIKVMTTEPPRRIEALSAHITMPARFNAEERRILEHIAHTCPVALSLSPQVLVTFEFEYALT